MRTREEKDDVKLERENGRGKRGRERRREVEVKRGESGSEREGGREG